MKKLFLTLAAATALTTGSSCKPNIGATTTVDATKVKVSDVVVNRDTYTLRKNEILSCPGNVSTYFNNNKVACEKLGLNFQKIQKDLEQMYPKFDPGQIDQMDQAKFCMRVAYFQLQNGLEVTGVIGPKTAELLKNPGSKPAVISQPSGTKKSDLARIPKSSVGVEIDPDIQAPSLPNNRFGQLPEKPHVNPDFIKKVKAVTFDQRKAKMIAVNGGGRASDEVAKLQALGLQPFDTLREIQQAYKDGKLVALPSVSKERYFAVGMIGTADPGNKPWYNLIHPDALIRFNQHVAGVFYAETGKFLKVGGLVRSEEYQKKLRQSNHQATKKTSPHEFGRTIDFSIPEVFNPVTKQVEQMSPDEREFISKLLTYYELNSPGRTSWLVENGNAYHGTHYPLKGK